MATSSEKIIEDENKINTIAIKLPFDLQDRILTFPFLHAIRKLYPQAELHFITPRQSIEILNLLPFTAYYHEFDDDEIKTFFDVHRFCANAKIFNIDLFISLTNSFPDACLGLGFRAHQRLGFSDGWKTLVLNQKVKRPVGHHICEDYFALLKAHTGVEINTRNNVTSRELPSIIVDWDSAPYIAINLSPIREAHIEDEWIELISRFQDQRFVFFSSDDQEKAQMYYESFLSKLTVKNTYVNFVYTSLIDLGKMLAYARGVITYNGAAAALSAYTGSKTIIIYDVEDPQRYGPFYFLADTLVMTQELKPAGKELLPRSKINIEEVAKRAYEFFILSVQ